MAHLATVLDSIDRESTARRFIDCVFRQHGLPVAIVIDRDPRFTNKFWKSIFRVLGTRLDMSTADHPQINGQTEHVNRVIEDVLRNVCPQTPNRWSSMLPVVEFALNNAVHASTGYTPFYVNGLTHPRVPLPISLRGSGLGVGELAERLADISPITVQKQVSEFLATRFSVYKHVRDTMADSQDKQKEQADAKGRSCTNSYMVGDRVLSNAKNLPANLVFAALKSELRPRFIGPFTVVAKKGLHYTLSLPSKLRTHPVFYVGLLKPYRDPSHLDLKARAPRQAVVPQIAASSLGCRAVPLYEVADTLAAKDGPEPPQKSSQPEQGPHEEVAPRAVEHQMLPPKFRSLPRCLMCGATFPFTWRKF